MYVDILLAINTLITRVNHIHCSIKNMQEFIGVVPIGQYDTIVARLEALEACCEQGNKPTGTWTSNTTGGVTPIIWDEFNEDTVIREVW